MRKIEFNVSSCKWDPTKEPKWGLANALRWLKICGAPWHIRLVFAAKWVLFRGRSVRINKYEMTFINMPKFDFFDVDIDKSLACPPNVKGSPGGEAAPVRPVVGPLSDTEK
jgi:hypothetical protein